MLGMRLMVVDVDGCWVSRDGVIYMMAVELYPVPAMLCSVSESSRASCRSVVRCRGGRQRADGSLVGGVGRTKVSESRPKMRRHEGAGQEEVWSC